MKLLFMSPPSQNSAQTRSGRRFDNGSGHNRRGRKVAVRSVAGAVAILAASQTLPANIAAAATDQTKAAQKAVQLFVDHEKPLGTVGGAQIGASGYGSSFAAAPGSNHIFFGLTDRGPNADLPDGNKLDPMPNFQPAIGEFALVGGNMVKLRSIGLRAANGHPYNGLVNSENSTGETMEDVDGHKLAPSPYGYDSEGLAVARDGSFWVSDEYGPFITHFDQSGRQLSRFSPTDGSLPKELINREPNKGMEGLTLAPDGKTLVGMMQASLNAPDGPKSKKCSALRIITVDIRTKKTHEYIYLLHNTDGANTTVSEISALNDHEFLVDERDSNFEPGANKKLFKISLKGATDVGPSASLPGSTYDASNGGLLIGGKSIEAIAGKANTQDATAALTKAGVTPVKSSLFLDYAGLVSAIDPKGGFFGHDKVEGVAITNGGRDVYLSNDSDFGIDGVSNTAAPWQIHAKTLPNGTVDSGEVLHVIMKKVPSQFK